jgi:hypothetical protein
VSVKELIRRINATLPEWKQFKFTRSDPVARLLFGDCYILDLRTHIPTLGKDVEQFARDLGCLSRGRRSGGRPRYGGTGRSPVGSRCLRPREGDKRVLLGLRDRRRHFNRLDNGRIVILRFVDACRDRPHPHRLGWERLHQITRIRIVT